MVLTPLATTNQERSRAMPLEMLKVVAVAIVSFSIGTTYINGRQSLEISQLNSKINDLQEQLEQSKKQVASAQSQAKKQSQLVQDFQRKWQQIK